MIYYVDASVIVALISGEDSRPHVEVALRNAIDRVVVSDFALAESAASLARLGRFEHWSTELTGFVLEELDAWAAVVARRLEIVPEDIRHAEAFVRQPGISLRAPDAIHIAAAHRLGATLLTLDHGMARAAAALGVDHLNPADADAFGEPKD